MVKLALILLTAAAAFAGRIVEFNPTSPVVTNRVVRYETSADTLQWLGKSNVLINPEVPTNSAFTNWKVTIAEGATNVVQMSSEELSAIAATNALIQLAETRALYKQELDDNKLWREAVKSLLTRHNYAVNQLRDIHANGIAAWRNGPAPTNTSGADLRIEIRGAIDAN